MKYIASILSKSLITCALMLSFCQAFAATVGDDFGALVEIADPEADMKVGDQFFSVNKENRRTSLLEITSVSGRSVMAKVLKGRANPGETLLKKSHAATEKKPAPSPSPTPPEVKEAPSNEGKILGDETSDTQTAEPQSNEPQANEWQMAQTQPKRKVSRSKTTTFFRLQGGVSYFSFQGTGAGDAKSSVGYSGGALIDRKSGSTTVETGLLFYQAGAKSVSGSEEAVIVLNYLGLPLIGKLNFSDAKEGSGFSIKGGVVVSYLLSASAKVNINGATLDATLTPDDKIDFLATAGVEFTYVESGTEYYFDLSYLYGLKNYESSGSKRVANAGLIGSIGIGF